MSDDPPNVPTFGTFAEKYIASGEDRWKNPHHQQNWRVSLRDYAKQLLEVPIDQIGKEDVYSVLEPIWQRLPQTAVRLRARIEKILDAAQAHGLRPQESPRSATWRDHMAHMLPLPPKLARGPYPSLPWRQAPPFMSELRKRQALAARCLELIILTASRGGEGLNATWAEIDLANSLWSIPAARMASNVDHDVPLSAQAVGLLEGLRPKPCEPDLPLFNVGGSTLSTKALSMLLRRMECEDVTVSGFRSAFREWAAESTDYSSDTIGQALGLKSQVPVGVSGNSQLNEQRRLMQDWSDYLDSE